MGEQTNGKKKRRISKDLRWTLAAVLICAFIWWNNSALTVERVSVEAPVEESIRIVQLSDLHGAWFGPEQTRLAAHVRAENPDVIALTGDFIDVRHDERAAASLLEALADIAPVYFVPGNHEYRAMRAGTGAYERLLQAIGQMGNVHILRGETVPLGEGAALTGADERDFAGGEEEYRGYIGDLSVQSDERYNILLAHRPIFFDDYAAAGFELTLAGHVHGGQFRLPFAGGVFTPDEGFFPEFDAGLYEHESGARMYINRGLGNSAFPLRLFNRPEIAVIEIVPA